MVHPMIIQYFGISLSLIFLMLFKMCLFVYIIRSHNPLELYIFFHTKFSIKLKIWL